MGQLALGVAMFAVQAASTVAGFVGQQQEAKANEKNAVQDWKNKQEAITKRTMQEQDALRQKQRMQNIEEAQVVSEVEASSASAGIDGISVENLKADVSRRAAMNRDADEQNTKMILSQLRTERKGVNAQAQGRINAVPRPSPLSLIAGLGKAAMSGVNTYNQPT